MEAASQTEKRVLAFSGVFNGITTIRWWIHRLDCWSERFETAGEREQQNSNALAQEGVFKRLADKLNYIFG
jgi:hypothetical protein